MALLGTAQFLLHRLFTVKWFPDQFFLATGADQAWVFDRKYAYLAAALVLLWGWQLLDLLRSRGALNLVSGLPFQITLLTGALACLIPNVILIPGYNHTLAFITERMSLAAGVSMCAVLGGSRPRATFRYQVFRPAKRFRRRQ